MDVPAGKARCASDESDELEFRGFVEVLGGPLPGVEPGPKAPQACMLPLHHSGRLAFFEDAVIKSLYFRGDDGAELNSKKINISLIFFQI